MKIHIILLCLIQSSLLAQRFDSIERNIKIPDYHVDNLPLVVHIKASGLPTNTDNTFGLEMVQLAIRHPYISDIKVELQSPTGEEIWLTNRNGRDGKDYIETRFRQDGFKGLISEGEAPFVGEYIPDGQLSNLNTGQNPNGTWLLKVYDLKTGDEGIFNSVSLFFSNKPANRAASPCTIKTSENCKCSDGSSTGKLLPDLILNHKTTFNNTIEMEPDNTGYGRLMFATEAVNVGYGSLEVRGTGKWFCDTVPVANSQLCANGSYARQTLEQVVYELKNGEISYNTRPAGTIAYDARPGHEHFHYDDFMLYTLYKVEGEKRTVINKGSKASFCIWNLGWCRDDLQNCTDSKNNVFTSKNLPNYGFGGKFNGCNEILQGLSVGGTDLYGENYEGQTLYIPPNTCNGEYILEIAIDPQNKFLESNKSNNLLINKIILTKQKECK